MQESLALYIQEVCIPFPICKTQKQDEWLSVRGEV